MLQIFLFSKSRQPLDLEHTHWHNNNKTAYVVASYKTLQVHILFLSDFFSPLKYWFTSYSFSRHSSISECEKDCQFPWQRLLVFSRHSGFPYHLQTDSFSISGILWLGSKTSILLLGFYSTSLSFSITMIHSFFHSQHQHSDIAFKLKHTIAVNNTRLGFYSLIPMCNWTLYWLMPGIL